MKKISLIYLIILVLTAPVVFAQAIPTATLVQIVKAEDELRYDKTLENLMKSADAKIRVRAALAAGRTGKSAAIPALIDLLKNDGANDVRATAAFALGEIEEHRGGGRDFANFERRKNAGSGACPRDGSRRKNRRRQSEGSKINGTRRSDFGHTRK